MEVGWGGVGRAAERARGCWGHCWGHCWEMPWSRAVWGWGGGATASVLEMSPDVAALKGGQVKSGISPVSGSVPLGASVSAATAPRCSESHASPPGWFRGRVRSGGSSCVKSCRGRQSPGPPENVLSPLM